MREFPHFLRFGNCKQNLFVIIQFQTGAGSSVARIDHFGLLFIDRGWSSLMNAQQPLLNVALRRNNSDDGRQMFMTLKLLTDSI